MFFSFNDFETLTIINLKPKTSPSVGVATYNLLPNSKNEWTIFIADSKSVLVGNLIYKDRVLHLDLLDPDSGKVLSNDILVATDNKYTDDKPRNYKRNF